jgi:hypothetical protein
MRYAAGLALLVLLGCRSDAPAFSEQLSAAEVEVDSAWLKQFVADHPNHLPLEISVNTMEVGPWDGADPCLPSRLRHAFDRKVNQQVDLAGPARNFGFEPLADAASRYWSKLTAGSSDAHEGLVFSRVVFDSSASTAFVWVNHFTTCKIYISECGGGSGELYKAEKKDERGWEFTGTRCRTWIQF